MTCRRSLAGALVQGADLTEAAALGHLSDLAGAFAIRANEKAELVGALAGADFAAGEVDLNAPLNEATAAAVHSFVARSNAALVLLQTEDLAMATIPVNLPGTDRERPNWRQDSNSGGLPF
jgi:4-alpha-glucanotransferase